MSAVQPHSFSLRSFIYWLVLGIVLCAVIYPAGVIILSSFETPGVKLVSGFGLQAWKIAFADPAIISAIWNTLRITLARQAIALPIALARLAYRTNRRSRRNDVEFCSGWVIFSAFALPILDSSHGPGLWRAQPVGRAFAIRN